MLVTGAIAIVAVAGLVLSTVGWMRATALNDSRTTVLLAAESFVHDLSNYDYVDVDQDFQAVLNDSTDGFKAQFANTASRLKASITDKEASGRGGIRDAAVAGISTDRATVLVIVDQTVVEENPQAQHLARGHLRLTLVRRDGAWLVEKLENL